jgi:hypothetical protein
MKVIEAVTTKGLRPGAWPRPLRAQIRVSVVLELNSNPVVTLPIHRFRNQESPVANEHDDCIERPIVGNRIDARRPGLVKIYELGAETSNQCLYDRPAVVVLGPRLIVADDGYSRDAAHVVA